MLYWVRSSAAMSPYTPSRSFIEAGRSRVPPVSRVRVVRSSSAGVGAKLSRIFGSRPMP